MLKIEKVFTKNRSKTQNASTSRQNNSMSVCADHCISWDIPPAQNQRIKFTHVQLPLQIFLNKIFKSFQEPSKILKNLCQSWRSSVFKILETRLKETKKQLKSFRMENKWFQMNFPTENYYEIYHKKLSWSLKNRQDEIKPWPAVKKQFKKICSKYSEVLVFGS